MKYGNDKLEYANGGKEIEKWRKTKMEVFNSLLPAASKSEATQVELLNNNDDLHNWNKMRLLDSDCIYH